MWAEQVAPPSGPTARHWPHRAAPAAIAVVLGALGHWPLAVAVLVIGATVAVVTTVSPIAQRFVAHLFAALSHGVGTALSFVLLGLLELLVMAPAAALQRILPRRGPWGHDAGSWQRHPPLEGLERRGFGTEPSVPVGHARHVARTANLVAGAVVVAVLVDFTAGAAIDHLRDDRQPSAGAGLTDVDPAMAPALAESSWAATYYEGLQRLRFEYVPFLYSRLVDTATPHVHSQGGVRRSYQSAADGDLPDVWLFGGSHLWGEGQRDDHTIPSELARIAQEDGLDIRVVNRGAPGYSSWQEALLFERVLAADPAPDLAVFYHGSNDTRMQAEHTTADPTHFDYPAIHETVTGQPIGVAAAAPVVDDDDPDGRFAPVWDRYVEASLVAKGLRQLRSAVATDRAGAAPTAVAGDAPEASDSDTIATTVAVYRRSRALSQSLGQQAGVTTRFFWQPEASPTSTYRAIAREVAPDTVDLTDALAGTDDPVWIDAVHTNELGARLAADALWRHLRPDIEAWYERERGES